LSLVDQVLIRLLFGAETIADQQSAAVATLVSDCGWLAIAPLAAVVVLRTSKRYECRRAEALEHRAMAPADTPHMAPALSG
jgi:hypothetical protein